MPDRQTHPSISQTALMPLVFGKAASLVLAMLTAVAGARPTLAQTADGNAQAVVGTVIRFSSEATSVDVTIGADTPAVRDFLSLLPLTLTLEEYAGREKISYLPRALTLDGSPGSDPKDGDLIYFIPWGNLGFYYDASSIVFSDQTLHIGTYDASLDQLEDLKGAVTVEVLP